IEALAPEKIIISPGPGRPADAGVCEAVVRELRTKMPILGVCLGEQGICEAYGATVGYAKELMHGKQSLTEIDTTSRIFAGLPEKVRVARYHSLAVEADTLPENLKVIAKTEDGEVMAVEDTEYPVFGLQFHPESIMTPDGTKMLRNFMEI
ncbi:MAG: aminodeoxychorismate/anthranilate synthase component II, partial [Dialister sp.]|nr:aminodeoxychorismate/anthranilate synthase component II [Dialister sp.]